MGNKMELKLKVEKKKEKKSKSLFDEVTDGKFYLNETR